MTKILCLMMAIASVLATPVITLAQVSPDDGQPTALSAPIQPSTPATADQGAPAGTRVPRMEPTIPIGLANRDALFAPVDTVDLDQFEEDLISLSEVLASISPAMSSEMTVGTFDEDHLQAMTDEQLTVMYNLMPDIVGFHLAVASLRESASQAATRRALAASAGETPTREQWEAQQARRQAHVDGLAPALKIDATPLSEPIMDPVFYTGGCPGTYYNGPAIYAFHVTRNSLAIADVLAKAAVDASEFVIFGGGTNIPFVIIWGVIKVAKDANNFGLDMVEFCDDSVTDSYTDTTYDNLIAILKNLNEHDTLEKAFLKEWRELYIRQEVEKNLLLTGDLRISLFQLPEQMMQHEGVGIARTQAIVLDTIQRNQLAGMPIGNAQTLYNDGVTLLGQNKYKDAYARFRSAYQAAVNQTVR